MAILCILPNIFHCQCCFGYYVFIITLCTASFCITVLPELLSFSIIIIFHCISLSQQTIKRAALLFQQSESLYSSWNINTRPLTSPWYRKESYTLRMKSQNGQRYSNLKSNTKSASSTSAHTTRNFRYRKVLKINTHTSHTHYNLVLAQLNSVYMADP